MALTPDDWAQVRHIFEEAIGRPRAGRGAFLDGACAGRDDVRAEVASLVAAHDRSSDFIERPVFQDAAHLLAADEPAPLDGRAIGPYLVRQEIGRGGMGIVYLADDTRLARRVALKALAPGAGRDPRHRDRLRQEARAAAALSHPGIATVYAIEDIDDSLYLACEYVPGPTLRTLLDGGRVPLAQVVDIAVQLGRALEAAHGQGVVHRDLKPENVVRTPAGIVKILDFGIARTAGLVESRVTQDGDRLGTPAYMAPEQVRGEAADFRTDLFSFGVLIYELATGSHPFEAGSRDATLARILELDPPPLSASLPDAPARLERLVAVCLRKSRVERYGSTHELVADIERLQAETSAEGAHTVVSPPAPQAHAAAAGAWSPRWWWERHQVIVSVVYVLMLYPAWQVRRWLPPPWGTVFLLTTLTCAAAATTLRLHLWFTSRFSASELAAERRSARVWTRLGDAGFAASLLAATADIAVDHQGFAMLFVTAAVGALLGSIVIEPATARAAFGSD